MYLILSLACILLVFYAQFRVKAAFTKYSKVPVSSGLSGAEAARRMLDSAGLGRVAIEPVQGFLSDHYDPRAKVLRLSPDVYNGRSLASVGVACHEAGHALQDANAYAPLVVRNAIVPTAGIGSNLGMVLIFVGLVLTGLIGPIGLRIAALGLVLYGAVVVFQIVNLPVEFNASARARKMLAQLGIVQGRQESAAIATMLSAAALTYVAATLTAIAHLLFYGLMIFGGRRN
jgi:hypothetical protein